MSELQVLFDMGSGLCWLILTSIKCKFRICVIVVLLLCMRSRILGRPMFTI